MALQTSPSAILLGLSTVLFLACGGGGGSSEGGNTVKPPATLSVSPTTATLTAGTTLLLNATGANFGTAHWSVLEVGGGTVNASGLQATYTAPSVTGTFHVIVKGDDPNVQAAAVVIVTENLDYLSLVMTPHIMNVQISPVGAILQPTQAQARIQTVRGSAKSRGRKQAIPPPPSGDLPLAAPASALEDAPVVWTLLEGPSAGAVNPDTGEYAHTTQPGVYHLVATRKDDPKISGTIEVVVRPASAAPPLVAPAASGFAIFPDRSLMEPGGEAFLKVNSGIVTYGLLEGTTAGTLTVTGGADQEVRYSAPSYPGVFTAVATSTSDSTQKSQAVLEVGQRVSVSVVPGLPKISPGSSATFTALVGNTSVTGVTWKIVEGPSGGSLSGSGNTITYTAPATPGKYHLQATSLADPNRNAEALVEVTGTGTVSVQTLNPPNRVEPGTQTVMVASVFGSGNPGVTWAVSAGTITADGLWTAPATLGPTTVTATSVADTSKSASSTITVANLPRFTSTPPTTTNVGLAYAYPFTATHPNGLAMAYSLEQGPTGSILAGNTITWTPTAGQANLTNTFILKATDSAGGIARQQWTVEFRVFVTANIVYLWQDGAQRSEILKDFSTRAINAFVPNGLGGYTTYAGAGFADGTFRIPNVPPGFYWLQLGTSFVWTSTNGGVINDDLNAGRPDRIPAVPPGSTLGATAITGLAPWVATDYLFALSPDSWLYGIPGFILSTPPAPGATSISGSWDVGSDFQDAANFFFNSALVEGNKNDRLFFYQMSTQTSPSGDPINVISRFKQPSSPVQMTVGSPFTVNVALAAPSGPSISFRTLVQRGPWLSLAPLVHPTANLVFDYPFSVGIDAFPKLNPATDEDLVPSGDIFFYLPLASVPATTFDSGQLTVADPWPISWLRRWSVSATYRVQYLLPGTTITAKKLGGMMTRAIGLPSAGTNTAPSVLPCQAFQINGLNAQIDQSGVGTGPLITWSPNGGNTETVTINKLDLYHLTASGSTTNRTLVATFNTSENHVQLVPGAMLPGEAYFLFLTSFAQAGGSRSVTASGIIRP